MSHVLLKNRLGALCVLAVFCLAAIPSTAPAQTPCDDMLVKLHPAIQKVKTIFGTTQPVIAMLHLAGKTPKAIIKRALFEMDVFSKRGVDAVIVENYHGSIGDVVRVLEALDGKFPDIVKGINILPNEIQLAYRIANHFDLKFIQFDYISGRYGGFRGGISLDVETYDKYRSLYPGIFVMGGVWPKYYSPYANSDLVKDLRTARERADAVVVTGEGTGSETPMAKIRQFRRILGVKFPLIVGAGVNLDNVSEQLPHAQGLIIGSYFKDGDTHAPVIGKRIADFMSAVSDVRAKSGQ